jgi:hypothetical protein
MTKRNLWYSLPLCMVIALLAAFLFVSPAFAQDETPPEVAPTEAPAEVVTEEVMPTEAPPVEELPTEAAPAEELPVEPATAEEAPATEPSLAEDLDEAGVVLSDQSGAPVSLATRVSGMTSKEDDPWFRIGSTTYQFINAVDYGSCGLTCWESPLPISDALQWLIDNNKTPDDRMLHIEAGTYNDNIDLWGLDNGVKGLVGVRGEAAADEVIINGWVYVEDFATGFSLSNLTVNDPFADDAAVWLTGNKGTVKLTDINANASEEDSSGIVIIHSGAVELNRVNSSDNGYVGAYISNSTTGAIKITNSTFDNNLQNVYDGSIFDCSGWDVNGNCMVGLDIWTPGPVTLFGVSASGNNGDGVNINGTNSAVTVKNSSFNNNSDYSPSDDTTFSGFGLSIAPTDYDDTYGYATAGANTVVLENIEANNNFGNGILVFAKTSFIGTHLHTDGNAPSGVYVNTCWDDGFVCKNIGAGTITINTSSSSNNGRNGFVLFSKGAVTLTSIYAGGNEEDGFLVYTSFSPLASAVTLTDLEVSGGRMNELDEWYQATENGINLNIKGPATLKDIIVSDNAQDGLHIESSGTGAITITQAANFFNESRNNGGNGYYIDTKGAVTITNFDTHDNGQLGGYIKNSGAASAMAVTVNLSATPEYMNGYWGNGKGGLEIHSRGVVTVSKVIAHDNGGSGLYINNLPPGTAAGVAVTVSDATFERNGAFGEAGLKISSKGAITLTNIRANDNGGVGALLDNKLAGGTAGVTINAGSGKGNEFQGNKLGGLIVHSNGAVTLTNIYSANNGMDSTELIGDFSITTHLLFDPIRNYELAGLVIYQDKNNYFQFGRAFCTNPEGCAGNTLYFDSFVDGNIVGGNYSTTLTLPAEIFLRLSRTGQTMTGWYSEDNSTWVSLGSHPVALDFQVNGVGLTSAQDFYREELVPQTPADFDFFDLSSPAIHDSFTDSFSQNWLWVNENGSNWNLSEHPGYLRIYASQSQTGGENLLVLPTTAGYGLYIDNIGGTGAVTLKQVGGWGVRDAWAEGNVFSNNSAGGLKILTKGAVTVAFFQARDNWGTGIQIDADDGSGAVTVSGMSNSWQNLFKNKGDGLKIEAKGLITVTNLSANGNSGYGAYFNNQVPGATGGVTINAVSGMGNEFQWNTLGGLKIMTNGAVTLTNIYASNNLNESVDPVTGGYGIYIDNFSGTAAVTIKQVGTWCGENFCTEGNTFSGNRDGGLWIKTKGAVTVSFFQARYNWDSGIFIDADGGSGAVTVTGLLNWGENLSDNGGSGLNISSLGTITVSKVQATRNSDWGARLANEIGTGSVTLTDAYFDENIENRLSGLKVTSAGAITWKNGTANNNGDYGAYLDNSYGLGKSVSVTNVTTSWNIKTGLYVLSKGVVTITDSQADTNSVRYDSISYGDWWSDNLSDGQLWNFSGSNGDKVTIEVNSLRFNPRVYVTDSAGTEIIRGEGVDGSLELNLTLTADDDYQIVVEAANNWNGYKYDIKFYSDVVGEPTIINHMSSANGIYVDNRSGTGGVTITNTGGRWNSNNSGTDVVIHSQGAVTLKNMDLNDSGEGGLWVDNTKVGAGASSVTLTNVNFNVNDGDAAYILTEGAVTVNSSNSGSNMGGGFYVDNTHESTVSPITFSNVSVDGYFGRHLGFTDPGIFLRSNGAVTFTNVNSSQFGGNGIDIDANGAVKFTEVGADSNLGYGARVITLSTFTIVGSPTGFSWFNNNLLDGLDVDAVGAISITKVYTGNNGFDWETGDYAESANGIRLISSNTLGTAPISLTNVTSNHNTADGLRILTLGAVTFNTLTMNDNIKFGIYLDQTGALDSTKAITLNLVTVNNNGFDSGYTNGWDGLYVLANGSITVNTLIALNNAGTGAALINDYGTGSVTMLNTLGNKYNVVVGNGRGYNGDQKHTGMLISSKGAVTINQLETIYNTGDGLVVYNDTTATIKPAVKLTNVISRFNLVGVYVYSTGVVTIDKSWATNNGEDGISVHTNNHVNILNTASLMNNWTGIWVESDSGKWKLTLTGSAWFGNLRNDPDPDDRNLLRWGDWDPIVY